MKNYGRITKKKTAGTMRKYSWRNIKHDFKINYSIYILIIPVLLFYLLFCYKPMYGAIIAFKSFSPAKGIFGSPWVGLKHFRDFFSGVYFWRVLKNTLVISITNLIFGFPAPIIFALLMNELTNKLFKRTVQTITYLPHFISLVVICSIIKEFTGTEGIINALFATGEKENLLNNPAYFVPIYVISGIWQSVGWGSILYLSALSTIDAELYEAARIDGAGHWKCAVHVTIPSIMPTITIMLILRLGQILTVGYEKIILLYSPMNYETSDVISSYVYRVGLSEGKYDYATAVNLLNSAVNFIFVFGGNTLSRKFSDSSLW